MLWVSDTRASARVQIELVELKEKVLCHCANNHAVITEMLINPDDNMPILFIE